MKSSAVVFLAAFVALSASWGGFVLAPQLQLGRAPQAKAVPSGDAYPVARTGVAQQGAEVYRSLGCVYCHSQQVGQEKTIAEVILFDAGTNSDVARAILAKVNPSLTNRDEIFRSLPQTIMQVPASEAAAPVVKSFAEVGAKAGVRVSQQGADLKRGWGQRATVAQDFLFENPVQPGTRRIGPDLANVGQRLQDVNWHLRHLYAPTLAVPGSTMPAYRFLFEKKKITGRPSADALQLPTELAAPAGYEIVPTEAARALAAYLMSLRADAPLFESPFTAAAPAPAAPATNSPAP